MISGQKVQDNQKFLEGVYLNPLTKYQSGDYVDPSHVMYDSQNSRWIDPSPELLSRTNQRDEEYEFSLPNGNNLRRSYPNPPDSNAPADPYYVQDNFNSRNLPVLTQEARLEASIATSSLVAGESFTGNNYNSTNATTIGDQSRRSPGLIDREVQSTQTNDLYANFISNSSYSEAPEIKQSKNKGTTQRKRKPWKMRNEFTYPRVWMTEKEMKLIDPEYEKNPRLAFKDMTNAKNGMKHRRNAEHEENERMKRHAPRTYVPNFVPKIYCPNGRLRECRDEWLRKKEMGEFRIPGQIG